MLLLTLVFTWVRAVPLFSERGNGLWPLKDALLISIQEDQDSAAHVNHFDADCHVIHPDHSELTAKLCQPMLELQGSNTMVIIKGPG